MSSTREAEGRKAEAGCQPPCSMRAVAALSEEVTQPLGLVHKSLVRNGAVWATGQDEHMDQAKKGFFSSVGSQILCSAAVMEAPVGPVP